MNIPFFDRRVINHFDFALIMLIVPLVGTSMFLIGEINETLLNKQIIYTIVGIIFFFIVFFIPIKKITWLIPFAYWFSVGLLIFVYFFGVTKLGARRWIEIPLIDITMQASEIFKPAFILMLAYLIERDPPPKEGYSWIKFLKLSTYILLPFFLIAKEPDLGTAMIVLFVGFGVLLVVGVRRRIWLSVFALIIAISPLAYERLHDYQKQRIHDFIIADRPSYHVRQSVIAIGSGHLFGKNKDEATQTQLRFLPISTSDFIFAYYVERFGFIGALVLLGIYASLIMHLLSLTQKMQNDYLALVVISSVAIMLFVYMSINIAMTVGLLPVVGVPLPLFSHGGSSFVNFIILFAIVENLLAFRFTFLYSTSMKIKQKNKTIL